jgi:hypothetical protein
MLSRTQASQLCRSCRKQCNLDFNVQAIVRVLTAVNLGGDPSCATVSLDPGGIGLPPSLNIQGGRRVVSLRFQPPELVSVGFRCAQCQPTIYIEFDRSAIRATAQASANVKWWGRGGLKKGVNIHISLILNSDSFFKTFLTLSVVIVDRLP